MTTVRRPSSQDALLEKVFGAGLEALHERAVGPGASPALVRALELRAFLAVAEVQVVRVRDRVRANMAPDAGLDTLDADALRFDVQWLEAAVEARSGYVTALSGLLAAMPPPAARPAAAPAAVQPARPAAPPRTGATPGRGR